MGQAFNPSCPWGRKLCGPRGLLGKRSAAGSELLDQGVWFFRFVTVMCSLDSKTSCNNVELANSEEQCRKFNISRER